MEPGVASTVETEAAIVIDQLVGRTAFAVQFPVVVDGVSQ